jgi:hypothetical protein
MSGSIAGGSQSMQMEPDKFVFAAHVSLWHRPPPPPTKRISFIQDPSGIDWLPPTVGLGTSYLAKFDKTMIGRSIKSPKSS